MAELQAGEGKEEKGKEEGGNDGEEGEGVRRLPQRTNSQRGEREEERRSRRALFQSVSTSNLNQQPSSSLPPPPLPRFHLGDLDQSALPPKLRGSRSLHGSPQPCSLQQRYGPIIRPPVVPVSRSPAYGSSSLTDGSCSSTPCSCPEPTRPPYYVADTLHVSLKDVRPTC